MTDEVIVPFFLAIQCGGRLGLHIPDTHASGYLAFIRYFYAQAGAEALILDDRFNSGGHFAMDIMHNLTQPRIATFTMRDAPKVPMPQGAIFGPKVMLVNEYSISGGDAMPWFFQRYGVGKVIGTRTWGGVIAGNQNWGGGTYRWRSGEYFFYGPAGRRRSRCR